VVAEGYRCGAGSVARSRRDCEGYSESRGSIHARYSRSLEELSSFLLVRNPDGREMNLVIDILVGRECTLNGQMLPGWSH
jgi:hypothetical protein